MTLEYVCKNLKPIRENKMQNNITPILCPKGIHDTISTKETVVAEQIKSKQYDTISSENAPIRQSITAEIPINELMNN